MLLLLLLWLAVFCIISQAYHVVPIGLKSHPRALLSSSSSSSSSLSTHWKKRRTSSIHHNTILYQQQVENDDASTSPSPTPPMKYVRAQDEDRSNTQKPMAPYPKIGDFVRYFDLDGGKSNGQVFVGKLTFIQTITQQSNKDNNDNEEDDDKYYLAEITEMDDVGDGYYVDYPSRQKRKRTILRKLQDISPLPASFVRTEDAWKVPMDPKTGWPKPIFEQYRLYDYDGPQKTIINENVLEQDATRYNDLKFRLFSDSALAGAIGTILAIFIRGPQLAIVYAGGAIAGVGYLYFLSIKTDTIGNKSRFGAQISNLRFFMPVLVLILVSLRNYFAGVGDVGDVDGGNLFQFVTLEQFTAAMLGFLTFRLPLFLSQLNTMFGDSTTSDFVPGSAGVVLQMAQGQQQEQEQQQTNKDTMINLMNTNKQENLKTILLVSGPTGTRRSILVQKLMELDSRFVSPIPIDRMTNGPKFEALEQKNAFLYVDETKRYGLTSESILNAVDDHANLKVTSTTTTTTTTTNDQDTDDDEDDNVILRPMVTVVDADVSLAKQLTTLKGARLVGVWIGLDSAEKFESRLKAMIDSGEWIVSTEDDEENETTLESIIRAKMKQIVKEIEYGVVSGIFEFTILDDDFDQSLSLLREAAEYSLKY